MWRWIIEEFCIELPLGSEKFHRVNRHTWQQTKCKETNYAKQLYILARRLFDFSLSPCEKLRKFLSSCFVVNTLLSNSYLQTENGGEISSNSYWDDSPVAHRCRTHVPLKRIGIQKWPIDSKICESIGKNFHLLLKYTLLFTIYKNGF